ncbi:hypothetical protein TrLO_g1366 [Triparma laevis f. longispina]|uniref:Uncharacterized protein n=1 Tax=Triparma laevis f. longispina TaxID=1714387 RepID=A0A9W7L0A8_9STRA|nr:hypothetical protein TrLO_g1366 [Triparma laevis f. longispina]
MNSPSKSKFLSLLHFLRALNRKRIAAVLVVIVFPLIKKFWDRYRRKTIEPSRQLQLLRSGLLTDLRITCTDGSVTCHAYQLSLHSPKLALQTSSEIKDLAWPCTRAEAEHVVKLCYGGEGGEVEGFEGKMRVFNVCVRWELEEIASQTIKQIINDFANQPTPTSDLLSLLKTTHNLSSEGYTLISSTLTNLVSLVAISMPQLLKEWEEEVLNLEPALFRLVIQSEEFGLENKDLLPLVLRYYEIHSVSVSMLVPSPPTSPTSTYPQLLHLLSTSLPPPSWKLQIPSNPEMEGQRLNGRFEDTVGMVSRASPTNTRQPWRSAGKGEEVGRFSDEKVRGSVEDFDPFA